MRKVCKGLGIERHVLLPLRLASRHKLDAEETVMGKSMLRLPLSGGGGGRVQTEYKSLVS